MTKKWRIRYFDPIVQSMVDRFFDYDAEAAALISILHERETVRVSKWLSGDSCDWIKVA